MKWVTIISLIIALAFMFLYFTKKETVVQVPIEVKVFDTVFVATRPDTVKIYRIITKLDTIVQANDTVFIQQDDTTWMSEKIWRSDYTWLRVQAFARAPVDSISAKQVIEWNRYYEDKVLPNLKFDCPKNDYKFWIGFGTGMAIVAGSVYLSSRLR